MARIFRNESIDQRHMTMQDRNSYRPSQVLEALDRVKSFKSNLKFQENRDKFRTEQKPGSGGLSMGSDTQAQRQYDQTSAIERLKALRPEENVDTDKYTVEQQSQDKLSNFLYNDAKGQFYDAANYKGGQQVSTPSDDKPDVQIKDNKDEWKE